MKSESKDVGKTSRRGFLQTVAAGVPTLSILAKAKARGLDWLGETEQGPFPGSEKFTPLDLASKFNATALDFGPHAQATLEGESGRDHLVRVYSGNRDLQGIPFRLGPGDVNKKSWVALSGKPSSWSTQAVEVTVAGKASFICVAAFCDWDANEEHPANPEVIEKIGQRLCDIEFVYEDQTTATLPFRRRFEVYDPIPVTGHACSNAMPDTKWGAGPLDAPLRSGEDWGGLQQGLRPFFGPYPYPSDWMLGIIWVSALPNPKPDSPIRLVRFRSASDDLLFLCGVTLFHGTVSPLRYEKLHVYRVTLPEATAEERDRWKLEVDLGIITRTFTLADFRPEEWLMDPAVGLGEPARAHEKRRHLYFEMTASPEAKLVLKDSKTSQSFEFNVGEVNGGGEVEGSRLGARAEILDPQRVWIHGAILDAATKQPTPVRLSMRSPNGQYIPPYGHRREVNAGWLQDYGADLQLGDTSFAYIDGRFQVELPVGDVYVEVTKGFEYEPIRRRVTIAPGQRELKLEISHLYDLRSQGWASGDTHVHFISPSTAVLEGQAEGLNLVNLLASQWGDMFTNVGDFHAGPLTSRDRETIVWIGTENRQHILGHINLIGTRSPIMPMCTGGPVESWIGDPVLSSMAEWADAARERDGLAVAPHFPWPNGELAADIVLGKLDAIEIRPAFGEQFDALNIQEYYRYLNCGYRLPIVGGTDKMQSGYPVGGERAYVYVGEGEFSFDLWAKGLKRGNTFMSAGPLLFLKVEGRNPGEEITVRSGGATLDITVEAKSAIPFHLVQVVMNGKVVASRDARNGTREMKLQENIKVDGPAWLAARCSSRFSTAHASDGYPFRVCAHTSPVYVNVSGQELFSPPAASYMLQLLQSSLTWLDNLAIRPDPEQFQRIRKVFIDAQERLHQRLHAQAIPH